MMDADVEVRCNAGYGEVTPDRVNSRNGYRLREWDTWAGTVELAIPKLRQGSYYPEFLEHRRRAERALASVVATSYLLGVSTRRVEKLAASLGSDVAVEVAGQPHGRRAGRDGRGLPVPAAGRGPVYLRVDRRAHPEGPRGRPDGERARPDRHRRERRGRREILGIEVASSEDGAGWLAFLRGLVARGLSGVALVTSDCHQGLRDAIASVLPGAAWQRCRTHYHRNLLTACPKSAQPWVSTLVRTISSSPMQPRCARSTPRS